MSRTFCKAEQNYARIKKEALGSSFGVCKSHAYLYGRHFTLLIYHRPYVIQYGKTAEHGNADETRPVHSAEVKKGTKYDTVLFKRSI